MSTNCENSASIRVWVDGPLRAAAQDPDNLRAVTLAYFIEDDVQASEQTAHLLLGWLNAVQSGEIESEDGTGNAFTVTIGRDDVFIENAVSDEFPSYRYTHDEFRQALEQVLTVLGKSNKDRSSDKEA